MAFRELKRKDDINKPMLEVRHSQEVKYLSRVLRGGEAGHRMGVRSEACEDVSERNGQDKSTAGGALQGKAANNTCRGIVSATWNCPLWPRHRARGKPRRPLAQRSASRVPSGSWPLAHGRAVGVPSMLSG